MRHLLAASLAATALLASPDDALAGKLKPGQTKVVSWTKATGGTPKSSGTPALSQTGRYVAFRTQRTELAGKASNNKMQILRHDRELGTYEVCSVTEQGALCLDDCQVPEISADGRYVTFDTDHNLDPTDLNNKRDVYRYDSTTQKAVRASRTYQGLTPNHASFSAKMSSDGRMVTFMSYATNMLASAGNGKRQVYRRDMQTGVVLLCSAALNGAYATENAGEPAISDDGRYVVFSTSAPNIGPSGQNIFRRDTFLGSTKLISKSHDGSPIDGGCFAPLISGDGSTVAFSSYATNITKKDKSKKTTDLFVVDVASGKVKQFVTKKGSKKADSFASDISGGGRWIAVNTSFSKEIPPKQGEIHPTYEYTDRISLIDAKKGKVRVVSKSSAGTTGNECSEAAISGNGKIIAFSSSDKKMGKDKDSYQDVYVHRR